MDCLLQFRMQRIAAKLEDGTISMPGIKMERDMDPKMMETPPSVPDLQILIYDKATS